MNISDSKLDLASLLSRIEQLEAEQNLTKQKVIWLKRYIDELKQQFNTRPELQPGMAQLSAQVTELQQHLNQLPTLSNSLDNTQITKAPTAFAHFNNAKEGVRRDPCKLGHVVNFSCGTHFSTVRSLILEG